MDLHIRPDIYGFVLPGGFCSGLACSVVVVEIAGLDSLQYLFQLSAAMIISKGSISINNMRVNFWLQWASFQSDLMLMAYFPFILH